MLEKGQLVSNVEIAGFDGATRRLWDFRQKSHVLVLVGDAALVAATAAKLAEGQKTLAWLGIEVIVAANIPDGFTPGAIAVDRFGLFIEQYPMDDALPARLEKDLIYYEACNCG